MFHAHQGRCRRRHRWATGGELALRVPAQQPRWQALPATRCLCGRATGVGGGGRRDALRAPAGPARPRPARRAGGWPAARHARPARPRWPARCPSAQGPAAAGGRAGGGGGGGGRRCCWPAARPGICPTAGSGPGLTLSSANESMQPGFRSDSLLNRQEYAKQYAEYVKEYAEYARCYAEYVEYALKYAEYGNMHGNM